MDELTSDQLARAIGLMAAAFQDPDPSYAMELAEVYADFITTGDRSKPRSAPSRGRELTEEELRETAARASASRQERKRMRDAEKLANPIGGGI